MSDWLSSVTKELGSPGSPWYDARRLLAGRFAERVRLEGFTLEQLHVVEKFVGKEFLMEHKLYKNVKPTSNARIVSNEEMQTCLKDLMLKAGKDANCTLSLNYKDRPECFNNFIDMIKNINKHNCNKLSSEQKSTNLYPILLKSSNESEALAAQIVRILQVDGGKLEEVVEKLKDKPMPSALRRYVYRLLLIKRKKLSSSSERSTRKSTEISQVEIRRLFATSVRRGMMELKIKDATKSPISYLIKSSLVETFSSLKGVEVFSEDLPLQQETYRVLNTWYTVCRKFEYYYALWCLPVQIVLSKNNTGREHDIEIAMWLDIIKDCVSEWPVLQKICSSIWKTITGSHFRDGKIKNHFWAMGIIDKREVLAILGENYTSTPQEKLNMSRSLHPVVIFRNWMLYLFVGCTNMRVTLFFWDQLFFCNWNVNCLKRICLVLIACLESEIVKCKDTTALFDVLTNYGNEVNLAEICKSWQLYSDVTL